MKVTALAITIVISSLPFINGYQTQRRTIHRLSHQELTLEQEEEEGLRHLSETASMSMMELVSNVTELVDVEATDGRVLQKAARRYRRAP